MNDMTPEYCSLMIHSRMCELMLHARDAAMQQDGDKMMLWLKQAREQYQKYIVELTTICERLPR